MCKARDGKQGSVVEVLDEYFMVDGSRHQNYFEPVVRQKKFSQLQQKKVAVDRALVYLDSVLCETNSMVCLVWRAYFIHDDVCYVVELVMGAEPPEQHSGSAEQQLGSFVLLILTSNGVANGPVIRALSRYTCRYGQCGDSPGLRNNDGCIRAMAILDKRVQYELRY